MSVRIVNLDEVSSLQAGDFVAIDNSSQGTHKFDATKLGDIMGANIASSYSSAATYAVGQFCIHNGNLYQCNTAISGGESWNASHWTQITVGVALYNKVDKVSGKGLSTQDFTTALKNKLDGIAAGAEVNVQSNWNETNTSSDAYIQNKPTNATQSTAGFMSAADKTKLDGIAAGAEVNVQPNWNETNTSSDAYIQNKPTDATQSVGGLMSASDKTKLDGIESGAEVNVQANWNETNTSSDAYIQNKPTNATTSTAGFMSAADKTKLDSVASGAQVNVIEGVKVDGTALTPDANKVVDIVGKANRSIIADAYDTTKSYEIGDYVIYNQVLYTCIAPATGTWDSSKWEVTVIANDLAKKANVDGYYDNMTVGNAEQLVSSLYNEESVPYNFRTSGGSLEIGDRETDEIVGGSVVWNQLVQNGNFASTNGWTTSTGGVVTASNNVLTVNVSNATGSYYSIRRVSTIKLLKNHKYLFGVDMKSSSGDGLIVPTGVTAEGYGGGVTDISYNFKRAEYIYNPADNYNAYLYLRFNRNGAAIMEISIKNYTVFDLTQMFGTTIADYIYNLEQNTAGAGVAWFKKLFPAPYYSYNAGAIYNVNAGMHVMNGFNQWDEQWESGYINPTTGEKANSPNNIRSQNYIPIIPNTAYYMTIGTAGTSTNGAFYDANKNFISATDSTANTTFTTPTNARYMRFYLSSSYGTTYHNDICINLSYDGERNGEYEPYVEHQYTLDSSLTLRGIPKLDENNSLYYDGDTYKSDGTVTRKYGIVDLGTLSWYYWSTEGLMIADISNQKSSGSQLNLVCSKYVVPVIAPVNWSGLADKNLIRGVSNSSVYVKDSSYTDAATFKTAMSGVYLVYELAEPTTESAEPFQNPQIVDNWGTETYIDADYDSNNRDVAIPVGHNTKYLANLKDKLEAAPNSPDGDGDYVVRQTSGVNTYVPLGSTPTIQAKADPDGTYEDMTVGNARQIYSDTFEEDEVPYTFRTAGGSIDIGDRETDEIVGGSVAWNQLVAVSNLSATRTIYNLSITNNNDGSLSVNGTADTSGSISFVNGLTFIDGHKYYVSTQQEPSFIYNGYNQTNIFNWTHGSTEGRLYLLVVSGTTYNFTSKPCIFDLTLMFGSAVADYIYSLEQAQAGDGVAWFKKLFPNDYYAYDAGTLKSVESLTSHDMVGFNQWDGTKNDGYYWSDSGVLTDYASNSCTNKIRLLPNTTYYFKRPESSSSASITVKFFNEDMHLISKTDISTVSTNRTLTTPNDVKYVIVNYGEPIFPEIFCINFHYDGERDGEYEPYVKHTYPLDNTLELRGIPKLDASNQLYYDGDTYESDGTVTRRYGIVDLGTLNWGYDTSSGTNPIFKTSEQLSVMKYGTYIPINFISQKYVRETSYYYTAAAFADNGSNGNITVQTSGAVGRVLVRDSAYETAEAFKTAMSGVYLIYELAEPTTETAEPFQNPQIVDNWGTEEYVTADTVTIPVPVGHDTKYMPNLRAKLEMAPNTPDGDGDYIMRQDSGVNTYVPLVIPNELPTMPTTDGTYRLQVVVSSGTATLSWVSAT